GVKYLTVYAFSTENWKRPADEVQAIMDILEKYLAEAIEKLERDRVNMRFFGDVSVLSARLQALIRKTEEISARFDGVRVNLCVNYGGRAELVRAVNAYRADPAAPPLTEDTLARYLYSADIPDPDLVIRPGGETRVSNFLLWQTAYSELYFTDVLWPDFTNRELDKAIAEYASRQRRFGAVES
ncbi:MAG: di-trans,poly-cis-decaprenylcistransferase, partial [Oscillospiraceae bacterium]|nr:di-trans,poly-cis-decaprenylcistransferase [Oscillospiraceae bacterium]